MRWVKYTSSAGLQIDLDGGPQFVVTASAVRVREGWGVSVRTSARSQGRPQKLASSKRGPWVFKGSVERQGQASTFEEAREGTDVVTLEREPIVFTREWPGDSTEKPLDPNDKLKLEVGLWGISGITSDTPLPVKTLFVVRATPGAGKPRVVVQKPEGFK